jgi:hypothetical protein
MENKLRHVRHGQIMSPPDGRIERTADCSLAGKLLMPVQYLPKI